MATISPEQFNPIALVKALSQDLRPHVSLCLGPSGQTTRHRAIVAQRFESGQKDADIAKA